MDQGNETMQAGLTCAEKQLLEYYQNIDLGQNAICQSCRNECPSLMSPVGAWAVGKKFDAHKIRLLFVGKNARGEPGEPYHFQSNFQNSRIYWRTKRRWPYWNYTREITQNIFGDDSMEHIAFTNIVKCNDSMGPDTTSAFTKKCCICELNVIGKEIDIIAPTHIVFYTNWYYDEFIPHIFDKFEIKVNTEITVGRKKMPWLEAEGVFHGKQIKILRTGHPERKNKADFISAICNWIL